MHQRMPKPSPTSLRSGHFTDAIENSSRHITSAFRVCPKWNSNPSIGTPFRRIGRKKNIVFKIFKRSVLVDHCANGQQLKCLTVTDGLTKEGLAIDVDARIRSPRVIDVLSKSVRDPLSCEGSPGPPRQGRYRWVMGR
jgi:hypothetical protein